MITGIKKPLPPFLLLAIFATAALFADDNPGFDWKAGKEKDGRIAVSVEIADNHYLYADATKVHVESSDGVKSMPSKGPSADRHIDEFQQESRIFKAGRHEWFFDPAGKTPHTVKIRYQGCSKSPFLCYPPKDVEIVIGGGLVRNAIDSAVSGGRRLADMEIKAPEAAVGRDLAPENSLVGRISGRGGWWVFLAAFLGGILNTLTPCVLPLIPITVAILSGGEKGGSASSSFLKVLAYVAGIIITFTALAALAAFSGKAFGAQLLGNQTFVFVFSLLFLVLSFSMLGLYELRLPSSLQTRLSSVGGGGAFGAFLMGLVAGLVAVPCTGPVLGALLGVAAASGNPLFSVSLLFSYACGFGVPFLFIASGAKVLPQKNGAFMVMVKSVLGIAIMVLAVYGFSIAIPAFGSFLADGPAFAKIASLLCVVAGFILGAVHADGGGPGLAARAAKIAGAMLVAFGIVWNLMSGPCPGEEHVRWLKYEESTLRRAADARRHVLLDFGAEWCAACKEMDATTFKDKAVVAELSSGWMPVKIDCTVNSPQIDALIRKYKVTGFPGFVVLSPGGEVKDSFTGYHAADEFLAKIRKARQPSRARVQ